MDNIPTSVIIDEKGTLIQCASSDKDLQRMLHEVFSRSDVPEAKYPVGTLVQIDWANMDVYTYFFRINRGNASHCNEDKHMYQRHATYRITRSELLRDFDNLPVVSYNLTPDPEDDEEGCLMYFMPEPYLKEVL